MPDASSSEIGRLAGEALPLRANRPLVSEAAFCWVISGPALGLRPFAHGGHGGGNRRQPAAPLRAALQAVAQVVPQLADLVRSAEHTSELQSLMRHSYAVFCL